MERDRIIQLIGAALLVVSLLISSISSTWLVASAGHNRLTYADRAEEGDPPEVALGIAMGAFRGVFVNFLWMRANDMKEAGRFHEANELARAITKLQPRYPRVWTFHAWNMAYNISVLTQTPRERWNWVQNGIRLLRNEGIPANPNDLLLHKELAWIYLHKIHGYTDDSNNYYKRKVAEEWTAVLGEPPKNLSLASREKATDAYVAWLETISKAPDSLRKLTESDATVAELVKRLQSEVDANLGLDFLYRYANHMELEKVAQKQMYIASMGPRSKIMQAMVEDERYADAWSKIMPVIRKRVLKDTYNMEPWRMVRYTRKYGPIDWRHPAAHALYWSARGVEESLDRVNTRNADDFDFLNTDRVTIQAVQELWRSGEIYFNFFDFYNSQNPRTTYFAMPNAHFVETYGIILDELINRGGLFENVEKRVFRPYAAGYENFLKDTIRFFYRRGQLDMAQKYYDRMRLWEGQNYNDPGRAERFSVPLEEFVVQEITNRQTSPSVAMQEIAGSLQASYINGLLGDNSQLFRQQFNYAAQFHAYFMQKQIRDSVVDSGVKRMEQIPTDFRLYAGYTFASLVASVDASDAELMYDNAPDDLRAYAYDVLEQRLRPLMEDFKARGGRSFDEVFPKPASLDQIREKINQANRRAIENEADVSEK